MMEYVDSHLLLVGAGRDLGSDPFQLAPELPCLGFHEYHCVLADPASNTQLLLLIGLGSRALLACEVLYYDTAASHQNCT